MKKCGMALTSFQMTNFQRGAPRVVIDRIANRVAAFKGWILVGQQQEVGAGTQLPAVGRHLVGQEPVRNMSSDENRAPDGECDSALYQDAEEQHRHAQWEP